MKPAGTLRQLSDFSDVSRGRRLRELLRHGEEPRSVRPSPDGRHLVVLQENRPPPLPPRVVAFQRQGGGGAELERSWQPPQPALAGLVFPQSPAAPGRWALGIVWEHGRTELWRFVPAAGWQLLQTLEIGRAHV